MIVLPTIQVYSWQDTIKIHIHGCLDTLLHACVLEPIVAVSDGSVMAGFGSAAWVITTASAWSKGHYIWGSTILPFEVEQVDSHRAELYGLLGINTTMQLYFKNVSNQTITYACDNHSALMYTFDTTRYERARSIYPDYDLIQSIRTTIPANLIIQHTHVKGHQDGKHRTLTFLEILNVFVDKCATNTCKEAIRLYKKQPGLHIASPHVHWHLQLNGFKIVKNISTSVYEYISERTMREYCSDKNIVNLDAFDDIHWKAHGQELHQNQFKDILVNKMYMLNHLHSR